MHTNKRLVALLSVLLILGTLLAPITALAGKGKSRWYNETGHVMVPEGATDDTVLSVGPVSVTLFPGSLPEGGPVVLHVKWTDEGVFRADFHPDRAFDVPVLIDFGTAETVVYTSHGSTEVIVTEDLDGDGEVGEIYSDHFSRFSGW